MLEQSHQCLSHQKRVQAYGSRSMYIYIKEFQVDDKGIQKTQYQIVALYVDDLIIAASTKNLLTALEGVFESRFKMKKLNQIKQILGMGVHHDKDRNIIYVTQQQYIEESLKQFNKYGISAFRTPMDATVDIQWDTPRHCLCGQYTGQVYMQPWSGTLESSSTYS